MCCTISGHKKRHCEKRHAFSTLLQARRLHAQRWMSRAPRAQPARAAARPHNRKTAPMRPHAPGSSASRIRLPSRGTRLQGWARRTDGPRGRSAGAAARRRCGAEPRSPACTKAASRRNESEPFGAAAQQHRATQSQDNSRSSTPAQAARFSIDQYGHYGAFEQNMHDGSAGKRVIVAQRACASWLSALKPAT